MKLAEKGRGNTAPNPMVGAVVVKGGKIVGRGYHKAVGGAHAEVNAIDDAGDAARGATLYVTLEPCHHTGRTPPCTKKILDAGIGRVVMAMADPNPDVKGGGAAFLVEKGIAVESGLCEKQARKLNEVFIKHVTTKNPFVLLKCAATLDGRIATKTGDARWVTGPSARNYVHGLRHWLDAIMVGIGTVMADDPSLTTRLDNRTGRNPVRIVLDTHLRIDENAKVLNFASDSQTIIVTGPQAASEQAPKKARLEEKGARVLTAEVENGQIALSPLMNRLGAMGITGILLEGGAKVIGSALKAGIVDKTAFFYGPKILGGDDGVPVCAGNGATLMADSLRVKDISVRRFDDDVLIEGYLDNDQCQIPNVK